MNWMMVLGSSGERLDSASSCLAGGGTPACKRREEVTICISYGFKYGLAQTVKHNCVTFTLQPGQRVKAALLFAGKEAVTIQEVGPGHFDGLKGVAAVPPQRIARVATRLDGLVILAAWGQHRAAHQTNFGGALPIEQAVDDAQEEVLRPRLCLHSTPVANNVGEYGSAAVTFDSRV